MMTQPIQMFENLTSENSQAGGNGLSKTSLSFDERRLLELRARYARAELLANSLGDVVLWLGRQYNRLVSAVKGDFKLRAAESQLFRMSDRELADIGLCRADITFAVRDNAEGVSPDIEGPTGTVLPANQNLRRVA